MSFTPEDSRAYARVLAGRPLNGEASRTSPAMLPLLVELGKVPPAERATWLNARLPDIMDGAEAARFAESVEAIDPDAPETPGDPWPDLPAATIGPVEPFPLDVLPNELADLARQGAKALQASPDYFAAPAIALAGGAIGRSVELSVSPTYSEAADLTIAVVGPPGAKKSPPLKTLLGPFHEADRKFRDAYVREREEYRRKMREWEAAKKRTDPGAEPVAPIHGHVTLDDTTREAVARIHSENLRGVILVLDELSSWVASMNVYRGGKGDDRQFWLKVRSGSLVKVTRKGSPDPLVISRPMIPIVGCLTPAGLPDMALARDDGWLDRILFAFPEPSPERLGGYTDATIAPELVDAWGAAIRRLRARSMIDDGTGNPRPVFIRFTDSARATWRAFVDSHHAEQRSPDFDESLVGPWSKLEGYTLRLALILSQLTWTYDTTASSNRPPDVTSRDVEGAARLCRYFKEHFRKVRAELAGDPLGLTEDARAILGWAAKESHQYFTANQVNEALGRFRGRLDRRNSALSRLVKAGVIRPVSPLPREGAGRKPTTCYELHPRFRDSGNAGIATGGPESLNKLNPCDPGEAVSRPGGADA